MRNINDTLSSQKRFFLALLGVLLIGVPVTIFALQQQTSVFNFAWSTQQSASSTCEPEMGVGVINVTFKNTESNKDMDVVAKDMQTGKSVDLGKIERSSAKSGQIVTEETSLKKGSVLFTLKWSDGSPGTDTRTATYNAVEECAPPPPFCPANPDLNEGRCKWDLLEGATGYDVVVTEKESGDTIKTISLPATASESAFLMKPNRTYTCSVTPINACGKGVKTVSPEKVCAPLTPTPSPTAPVCPKDQGVCKWDPLENANEYNVTVKDTKSGETVKNGTVKAPETKFAFPMDPTKTYQCIVTAVNKCSETPPSESPPKTCVVPSVTPTPPPSGTPPPSPTPTKIPTPTPTTPPSPTPTKTPTPTPTTPPSPTPTRVPTPTPVVIVRIPPNVAPPTQPPVVVQQPPQTVVQQQPPVVVQQPPQTIVQQQPPVVVQTTPVPTIKPTGSVSNSLIVVAASLVLVLVGGVVFLLI